MIVWWRIFKRLKDNHPVAKGIRAAFPHELKICKTQRFCSWNKRSYLSTKVCSRAWWWRWTIERSEKDQNYKLQFPLADYLPCNSADFRAVFEIEIGPFSFCEISKTWGTIKQLNKQRNKNWKFQYSQPHLEPRNTNEQVFIYTICGDVHPLLRILNFFRNKMRKSPL